MDEEKPRKRPTTKFSRSARNKRILERLREGFAYDQVAREEGLTARRLQIAAQAREGDEAPENATHADMEIHRLGRAMRVAVSRGDIRRPSPLRGHGADPPAPDFFRPESPVSP